MRDRREIDPHSNDLHCVDVSTYEDVVYDANPRTKCDAEFPIIKETKQERVSNFDSTYDLSIFLRFSAVFGTKSANLSHGYKKIINEVFLGVQGSYYTSM